MPTGRASERDAETLRLLVHQDQEGLRRLLTDYGTIVRTALQREFHKTLDSQDIDEVISQASHRAWRSASSCDLAKGTLVGWFLTIARNCGRRLAGVRLRRKSQFVSLTEALEAQMPGAVPSYDPDLEIQGTPEQVRILRELHACIQELPRMQRWVVLADLEAGGTGNVEELAARFNTSCNSIYVSRTNGRKKLRGVLAKLDSPFWREAEAEVQQLLAPEGDPAPDIPPGTVLPARPPTSPPKASAARPKPGRPKTGRPPSSRDRNPNKPRKASP